MRISDVSSDVCSSDLFDATDKGQVDRPCGINPWQAGRSRYAPLIMTVRDNQPRLVRKCWIRGQQKVARTRRQEYKPVQRSKKAPAPKPERPALAPMGQHNMSEPGNILPPPHPPPPPIATHH